MNDKKNENQVDETNKTSSESTFFNLLGYVISTPILSILLGLTMVIYYDLVGDWWLGSGKGLILWFFWSRPVGVCLLAFGICTIWETKSLWHRDLLKSENDSIE